MEEGFSRSRIEALNGMNGHTKATNGTALGAESTTQRVIDSAERVATAAVQARYGAAARPAAGPPASPPPPPNEPNWFQRYGDDGRSIQTDWMKVGLLAAAAVGVYLFMRKRRKS